MSESAELRDPPSVEDSPKLEPNKVEDSPGESGNVNDNSVDPPTDSDDDFDDFNEYTSNNNNEDDDKDSFGSFEEEEDGHGEVQAASAPHGNASSLHTDPAVANDAHDSIIRFDDEAFEDSEIFNSKLNALLGEFFTPKGGVAPEDTPQDIASSNTILSSRSESIFEQLSAFPHLKPPNWIKSKVRRHLMTKLGVPVNLDEINEPSAAAAAATKAPPSATVQKPASSTLQKPVQRHRRASSVSEQDINWDEFTIPKLQDLKIDSDREKSLILETPTIISTIEIENLDHSSTQRLLASSDEDVDKLVEQYQANFSKLVELSSVWQNQLHELKKDYEIYESVVQNLVGHTQRLKREEIMANLNKVKMKKGRKHRS